VSSSFCLAKIWFGSSFPVQVFVYLSGFWWPEKLEIGFFLVLFCRTQLARQLQQERAQVVCSNKVARKRLARRHSRNGPWTHESCFDVMYFYVGGVFRMWNVVFT